ncbi:hypothetical protein BX600DRAFT_84578 [Xylariales sp. PMI_506]|nr:hypothetical protein BX600DRAFT_84578 [Xylariales sp. PMI_506]
MEKGVSSTADSSTDACTTATLRLQVFPVTPMCGLGCIARHRGWRHVPGVFLYKGVRELSDLNTNRLVFNTNQMPGYPDVNQTNSKYPIPLVRSLGDACVVRVVGLVRNCGRSRAGHFPESWAVLTCKDGRFAIYLKVLWFQNGDGVAWGFSGSLGVFGWS